MSKNRERALVLGANGFIGSHLVDTLVDSGYDVRAFDSFSKDPMFNESDRVELFPGNFLNNADIESSLNDVDYVFHFISTTNPATAEADPLIDIDTNIRGSVSLFKACVAVGGIKRVIYASSGGTVYGETSHNLPILESQGTVPVSPYGIGKVTVENYLRYFKKKSDLDSTTFRIANPYGERQSLRKKQGVIPIFIDKAIKGDQATVLGDGSMVRDYIYVKDVADMIVRTLQKNPSHDVYNIGSGSGHSVSEIVEEIENVSGLDINISHKEAPSTFVHTSVLSMDRYNKEFGAFPSTSLSDGIKRTYEYMRENE